MKPQSWFKTADFTTSVCNLALKLNHFEFCSVGVFLLIRMSDMYSGNYINLLFDFLKLVHILFFKETCDWNKNEWNENAKIPISEDLSKTIFQRGLLKFLIQCTPKTNSCL
jgi:hypothetical protein